MMKCQLIRRCNMAPSLQVCCTIFRCSYSA